MDHADAFSKANYIEAPLKDLPEKFMNAQSDTNNETYPSGLVMRRSGLRKEYLLQRFRGKFAKRY